MTWASGKAWKGSEYSDPIHMHAQKCMFAYLQDRGAANEESLRSMIAAKNKLVAQFREVHVEDKTITGKEIRVALFKAFDKVWKAA